MSENCTHDCSNCNQDCSKKDFRAKLNNLSSVKKVIGVVSGKGGVGKSLCTALMAICARQKGYNTAIIDADITGPSIPKVFGLKEKAVSPDGQYLAPVKTSIGIDVMSINLLLENDNDPVVWRGPVIAGTVKQFWTDVIWQDIDFMFVDMPPGTGDVPLTVFQSLPLDGIIVVSSPQDLVSMIVSKAVKMANLMNVPVLGIVENMSYLECPDCKRKIEIFGQSKVGAIANEYNIKNIAKIPLNPIIPDLCDKGLIEQIDCSFISDFADKILNKK